MSALGAMPENIFDVGCEVIDATEKGVHTGSNAVHGVNKDIEDQTGQHDFDRNSALEYCVDEKNPIECIRDNLMKMKIHSKPVNKVIFWKLLGACVDQKDTADCIRESFNRFDKKTENVFIKSIIKLVWEPARACVRDNSCFKTSICKYFKILQLYFF